MEIPDNPNYKNIFALPKNQPNRFLLLVGENIVILVFIHQILMLSRGNMSLKIRSPNGKIMIFPSLSAKNRFG